MGRKRKTTGKHLFLCVAGLIILSFLGCAFVEKGKGTGRDKEEFLPYLLQGRNLLALGDYEGALRENRKVLSLAGQKPPADEALFHLGLIYAHPGNQKKDYRKSLDYFKTLMKDFPQSPWIEQTKVMTGLLQDNEKLSQTAEKLNQTVEKLNEVIEKSTRVDIEIDEMKRQKGK